MSAGRPALLAICALGFFCVGCNSSVEREGTGKLIGWSRMPLEHARFFQLWEKGTDRALVTFGPGGERDTTGMHFIVNIQQPDHPAGSTLLGAEVSRIALSSTTLAPFVLLLGQEEAIAGCAHADMLKAPALTARAKAGTLQELARGDGLDRERLALLNAQVLFTDPFSANATKGMASMPPQCVVAEYLEQDPLGRAEWIKAFGAVLGKSAHADSVYAAITMRYYEAAALVPENTKRPAVFFGSAWRGVWSVPSGNSYMAKLIQDAGGRYLFADKLAQGNSDLDMETVMLRGQEAEWWGRVLDQQRPVDMQDVAGGESRIAYLPALVGRRGFYANSAESDIFGQAVLEPDVQLRDLIDIFHPELNTGRKPVYFRRVQ